MWNDIRDGSKDESVVFIMGSPLAVTSGRSKMALSNGDRLTGHGLYVLDFVLMKDILVTFGKPQGLLLKFCIILIIDLTN